LLSEKCRTSFDFSSIFQVSSLRNQDEPAEICSQLRPLLYIFSNSGLSGDNISRFVSISLKSLDIELSSITLYQEMHMNVTIPKVWKLLDLFKDQCRLRGWKTSEHEDWVKTRDDEYHNFLWIQTVHPSTFEKIALNRKCAIREGISYKVVDVSCTAWLFPQGPPENLMQTFEENPELSRRTAIYDLSLAYAGKPLSLKLNETDSMVFQEFEKFLQEKLGIEVKSAYTMPALKT
jgi:hypothetical protein